MSRKTVTVVDAEQLLLSKAVQRVASVLGSPRRRGVLAGVGATRARAGHRVDHEVPLVATAQERMLADGVTDGAPSQHPCPTPFAHVAGSRPADSPRPPRADGFG